MGPLVIPSIFSFSSILFFLVELDARPRRTGAGLLRPPPPTPAPSARSATAIAPALASSARPAPPAASSAHQYCTRPAPRRSPQPSLAPPTPSRPPWPPRSTSPAMAAQLELAHHGRPDRGRPPWLPPARGQPPWPWHLLLLAHGRAAQPHLLPTPTPHAGSPARSSARSPAPVAPPAPTLPSSSTRPQRR